VRRSLRAALEQCRPGVAISLAGGGRVAEGDPGARRTAAVEQAFLGGVGRPADAERAFAFAPGVRTDVVDGVRESVAGGPVEEAACTASGLRPIGQALGTYLLLEGDGELVLVDQHALHERVLFDQINDRLRTDGNLEVQRLLVPMVVHLDPAEAARLLEQRDLLRTLGWVVEAFGPGDGGEESVAIHGVPAVLRRPDPEGALQALAGLLERGQRDGLDRAHLLSAAVDSLACRSAVMAGDVLHADEVLALLDQAEGLNHSHSCPHGRPTRLTLTRGQLERWFHRTV